MTKEAKVEEAKVEKVFQRTLPANRLKQAKHEEQHFRVTIDSGTDEKDVLEPVFWSKCAAQFRPFDQVTCIWADGSLHISLLVLDASQDKGATMFVASRHELPELDRGSEMPSHLVIEWTGPEGFSVIRKSDGRIVSPGHRYRHQAYSAALIHAQDRVA